MKRLIGCLVWVRFGWKGARQLAHVSRIYYDDIVCVHKWRDASRRWTGAVLVKLSDVLPETVVLVDRIVQHAIKAATVGRPPCRHHHHFVPQVKTISPTRRASDAFAAGAGGVR